MRGAVLVRRRAAAFCAAVAACALAGCSTQTNTAVTVSGKTLTIYLSRPPGAAGGQAATDVLDAERLAARQSPDTAGKFKLEFAELGRRELTANARTAVQNTSAIAYLGEIDPGTSQLTVPITNELGLLEISPTDTAVYLTQATAAVSDSPGTFYPSSSSYHKTFARVVPTTAAEAQALISELRKLGLTRLYVGDDGSSYGASIALEMRSDASVAGLVAVSSPAAADAIFYGAVPGATATAALDRFATQAPGVKLFAPSALYDDTFVAGLSAAAQANLLVSSPGFMASGLTPSGRQFESAFTAAYGRAPAPEAIFGYEAVSALVAVLGQEGASAGNRADVVSAFRTLKNRSSVLGTYSIVGGDTTIAPFVIARPEGGKLVPRGPI
jgi:branched-chain amino acid transport system substrate-binding protein